MFEIRCDPVSSEQRRAETNRGSIICPGGNALVPSLSLEVYMLILQKTLLSVKANTGRAGVFLDGKYRGSAANFRVALIDPVPAGEHELKLIDPRFEELITRVSSMRSLPYTSRALCLILTRPSRPVSGPLQLHARGASLVSARIAPGARQPRRHHFGGDRQDGCRAPICGERRHCACQSPPAELTA